MSSRLSSLTPPELVALLEARNTPPPCVDAIRADRFTGREFFGDPTTITPEQVVDESFDEDTIRTHRIKPAHIRSLKQILNELLAAERSGPPQQQKAAAVAQLAPEPARDDDAPRGAAAAAAVAAVAPPACTPAETPVAPPKPAGKKKKQRPQQQQTVAVNDGDDDGDVPPPPPPAPAPALATTPPTSDLSLPKKTANTINNQETQGRTNITKNEDKEFLKLPLPQFAAPQQRQQEKPSPKLGADRIKMENDEAAARGTIAKSESDERRTLRTRKSSDKQEAAGCEMLREVVARLSRVCKICKQPLRESSFSSMEWAVATPAAAAASHGGGGGAAAAAASSATSSTTGGTCLECVANRPAQWELFTAVAADNVTLVRDLLRRGADVNENNDQGWAPLHRAACDGHAEMIAELLKAGADKGAVLPDGRTAVYIAAEHNHLDALRCLISAGGDFNKATSDGWTPLHVAGAIGHAEIVAYLLKAGADKDAAIHDGRSAVYLAAQENRLDALRRLITAGCDVNKPANNGVTPLHVAAAEGHAAIAAELLRAGASKTARTGGKTALEWAREKGHTEVVKMLEC